jgi:enterochelin esterase family protein
LSPDGRATVRLLAPKATEVRVSGPAGNLPMVKGEDGVWSVTFGPLKPDVYEYRLILDGVTVLDPANQSIKSASDNFLYMPGSPPELWEEQKVPHGKVQILWYDSKATGTLRRVHVYTPPGYDPTKRVRYPVLYLLHGAGDDDSGWMKIGRANAILDNLIAQGKARPMLIVMPVGQVPFRRDAPVSREASQDLFAKDLLGDVIPLVESTYLARPGAANRALVGLSMGGGQTRRIALGKDAGERFQYVGVLSAGRQADDSVDADPEVLKKRLKLLWISCGAAEAMKGLPNWLTSHGVAHVYREYEGGHEWRVWRRSLGDLAPMLFGKD